MDLEKLIKNRRSTRKFKDTPVEDEKIEQIVEAARWAPSGLNNQPWRFYLADEGERDKISGFTKYSNIIKNSKACICVFLDGEAVYDHTKDVQAVGACIQNMLLEAESMGIGTCWLGQILNQKEKVNSALGIGERYELMAVIALGYPDEKPVSGRKDVGELMIEKE